MLREGAVILQLPARGASLIYGYTGAGMQLVTCRGAVLQCSCKQERR
jgi:hypothetical protein